MSLQVSGWNLGRDELRLRQFQMRLRGSHRKLLYTPLEPYEARTRTAIGKSGKDVELLEEAHLLRGSLL